jgi:hypothetical protein
MTQKVSSSGLDNKIEKDRKKLFDRLRKLNKITSEEELKKLEKMFEQKPKYGSFCLTGIEITLDQLIGIYNDISERTNCPVKYVKRR